MVSLRHAALGGARWTGLSSAAVGILQLAQLTILARLLTPGDFGLMGMVMLTLGLVQPFSDIGISAAIIHRQNVTRRELSSLYWLNIFAAAALYLVILAGIPLVARFFDEPRLRALIPAAALTLVIGAIGSQFQVLFRKELRFDIIARRTVSAAVAGAAVAITMAFVGMGVWSLVGGAMANTFFGTLLIAVPGWKAWRPSLHFDRADLGPYMGFGAFQLGERLVNIFNSRIDQLVIGSMLGTQALGFYTFSHHLVIQPTARINPIVTAVAFPVFARMQNEQARLQRAYLLALRALNNVNAPLLLGLAALAPVAVPFAFGEQWTRAVPVIQILCAYSLLRSTGNPVGSLLLAKGRADLGFTWNVALLMLTAPAVYLGGRFGGVLGVAVALVALQAVLSIINYKLLVRALIGSCLREYMVAMGRPALLATVTAGMVLFAGFLLASVPVWVKLGLQVALGAILTAALAWTFERRVVVEVLRRERLPPGARPAALVCTGAKVSHD